jgi:L-aminopeptidase/D-esterase-like protein
VLTGGSVFGLDSACGVVKYLEDHQVGFNTGAARVPIVPAAVIYDLAVGSASVRPDARMGRQACERASSECVEEGRVGAGAGATVGKILGPALASPGGVGTASIRLPSGVTVGALVVVNAFGDIIDPESGRILSGARAIKGSGWLDTSRAIEQAVLSNPASFSAIENTTLAVIATDGALTKAQAQRVAMMAHDGLARAIRPVHTMFDGDTVFALSAGSLQADVTAIGSVAADLLARAVARVGRMFNQP